MALPVVEFARRSLLRVLANHTEVVTLRDQDPNDQSSDPRLVKATPNGLLNMRLADLGLTNQSQIELWLDDVKAATRNVAVGRSRARVTAQFGIQAARLVGTQFMAAGVAFATAWDKLAGTELVVAVIAALAAGYGADTVKSVGAAIVSKVTGTSASAAVKQQTFAKANAELEA